MITSRSANIYEGAAGERLLGGQAMTTDTVFASAAAQLENRNDGTGSLLFADKRMLTTGGVS
jgi:hypothetical protein